MQKVLTMQSNGAQVWRNEPRVIRGTLNQPAGDPITFTPWGELPEGVSISWKKSEDIEGGYEATVDGLQEGEKLFVTGSDLPTSLPFIGVSENTVEYMFGQWGLLNAYAIEIYIY